MLLDFTTVFVLASLIAGSSSFQPTTCPFMQNLDVQFASVADAVVPLSALNPDPDAGASFLTDILRFSNEEIDSFTQDAIDFFNTKYGLDFSQSEPDELGRRFLPGASLQLFRLSPLIGYTITFNRWIINGRERTLCFENRDGGYVVNFNSSQMLFGTYGGEEGKPIAVGDALVYGFYSLPFCPQSPVIIRYTSGSPARIEPEDGFGIINCDLFNRELGTGSAQGVFRITPVGEDMVHFSIRNLFTFPASPGIP